MRSTLNLAAIARLDRHPQVQDDTEEAAQFVADKARSLAAKDTGAGAASIHAEPLRGGGWGVSWDPAHDYMRFPEFGTEDMPPQPALRPAARALGDNK